MKQNKIFIAGILFLVVLLSMNIVMAGSPSASNITFITPLASSTNTGSITVNVSFNITGYDTQNWSKMWLYVSGGSGCANTTRLEVNTTMNNTARKSYFTLNTTISSEQFADCTTMTINATLSNLSVNTITNITKTITGVTFDNTAPNCSFTIDRDNIEVFDLLGIETTQSSNDVTTLTYAWKLFNEQGNVLKTYTTSAPVFSQGDIAEIGNLNLGLIVTDAVAQTTTCTNKSIFVSGSDDDTSDVITSQAKSISTKNSMILVIGIVVLLFIIIGAFFLISASKKRR